jgi:hypothetical protein
MAATVLVSKMSWSQKCLAVSSPSSTVPETADTTTMLIRFCATIDNADAAAGGGFAVLLAFLRFGFWDVVFAAIAFPGDGGSGRIAA